MEAEGESLKPRVWSSEHELLNGFLRHCIGHTALGQESAIRLVNINNNLENSLLSNDVANALSSIEFPDMPVTPGLRTIDDFNNESKAFLIADNTTGFSLCNIMGNKEGYIDLQNTPSIHHYARPSYAGLVSGSENQYYRLDTQRPGGDGGSKSKAIFINAELSRLLIYHGIGEPTVDRVFRSVKRRYGSMRHPYSLRDEDRKKIAY